NWADRRHLERMQVLAASLSVQFLPRVGVTHEELIDTLSRAACMLYTPRLEPFGYAPLEAGACGTLVVAIAEGGMRESILGGVSHNRPPPVPRSHRAPSRVPCGCRRPTGANGEPRVTPATWSELAINWPGAVSVAGRSLRRRGRSMRRPRVLAVGSRSVC